VGALCLLKKRAGAKFRGKPFEYLKYLRHHVGMSVPRIGSFLGVENRIIHVWLDEHKIDSPEISPRIIRTAHRVGFACLSDYFTRRGSQCLVLMADDLMVSRSTVESYYRAFIESKEE